MIVVDSSVWIDFFAARPTRAALTLKERIEPDTVIVGDIVLAEVLMGARSAGHAAQLETALRRFRVETMGGTEAAIMAAAHYRHLRTHGFTVRRATDMFIGTFCIARGYALLHAERDFEPMVTHLGLTVL